RRHVIGGLSRIVVRFGNQVVLVERLPALPVQILLLERSLRAEQIGLSGLFGGDIGVHVRLRRLNGGLLRRDVGRRLYIFHGRKNLPAFHVIALFYVEVSDAAN